MHEEPAFHGRSYLLKIGTQTIPATLTNLKHRTSVDTLERMAATQLNLNEVGTVTLARTSPSPLTAMAPIRAPAASS